MGRNDRKFNFAQYHINTMEIIKLFVIKNYMSVSTLIDNFIILQKEALSDLWSIQGII